jgi:serine/threonine protein kinase
VLQRIEAPPDATGGNFSTCYRAQRDDRQAFLKAIDIHKVLRQHPGQLMAVMQHVSGAYLHEKKLLDACLSRRMDRVVQTIDSGEELLEIGDPTSVVFYLVFEVAEGDIRKVLNSATPELDLGEIFRVLQCVAVGIKQLHSGEIAHQDLKPSNVLSFVENDGSIARISDLGRASTPSASMDHDTAPCPGAKSYWPPEAIFDGAQPDWDGRRACDLYQLGSLMLFLLTGVSTTAALINGLPMAYVPYSFGGPYEGTFEDALPVLRSTLNDVCDSFPDLEDQELHSRVLRIFRELCAPDAMERGHPRNRRPGHDRRSVERYVSEFDLLARRNSRRTVKRAA